MRENETAQLYQRYEGCFLINSAKLAEMTTEYLEIVIIQKATQSLNSAKRQFHLPEVRETMKERLNSDQQYELAGELKPQTRNLQENWQRK